MRSGGRERRSRLVRLWESEVIGFGCFLIEPDCSLGGI